MTLSTGLSVIKAGWAILRLYIARSLLKSKAEKLAPFEQTEQMFTIDELDSRIARFGRLVRRPGLIVGTVNKIIRLGERGTITQIMDILS
jgi:hypothetical protein